MVAHIRIIQTSTWISISTAAITTVCLSKADIRITGTGSHIATMQLQLAMHRSRTMIIQLAAVIKTTSELFTLSFYYKK